MSKNVKSFFESHVHRYVNNPGFYSLIVREIRSIIPQQKPLIFLDVGCGDGSFIKALIEEGFLAEYLATDLSLNMLSKARTNLSGRKVGLFVADAFHLSLKEGIKFDIIHIDSVLHHLIGSTRGQSTKLAERMVKTLLGRLSDNGILIVEEVYYDSYLIPEITAFLVFHGLKLINFFHLDLTFTKEIRRGLEVNFLHEKTLVKMLNKYGSAKLLNRVVVEVPKTYQMFLLKERGHLTYSTRKFDQRSQFQRMTS